MTLEQLGFVREQDGDIVLFSRPKIIIDDYAYIEFYPKYKEFELTNISILDMELLEAIYAEAKELFE